MTGFWTVEVSVIALFTFWNVHFQLMGLLSDSLLNVTTSGLSTAVHVITPTAWLFKFDCIDLVGFLEIKRRNGLFKFANLGGATDGTTAVDRVLTFTCSVKAVWRGVIVNVGVWNWTNTLEEGNVNVLPSVTTVFRYRLRISGFHLSQWEWIHNPTVFNTIVV